MKEGNQSLMSALSVNLVTVNLLLSVFFLPGVWARCGAVTPSLHITTPNMMEALSGSCLLIPCSFTFTANTFGSSERFFGVWINGDRNIFDSRDSVKAFPVNITGDLKQRDCTSVFSDLQAIHSGEYFFRFEGERDRATACANPVPITVKDSPWSPRIDISGDLKEKQSVSITCSALTPCPLSPPELTWNLQPDSHRQTETNPNGTITTKIQENITLSDTHDGYNISCSVRYPVDGGKGFKTAETEVTLNVSYAPKDTSASISPSGLVSAGSWVNLSCSSRANPPVSSFSWFRISSEGPVNVSEGRLYRFNVTEGGEFYCVATNDLGNQNSSVIVLSVGGSLLDIPIWMIILGGIVAVILVGLVVFCCFKFKRRTHQQTQSQIYEEVAAQTAADKEEEELHYGDVMFFKRRPEASAVSEQDRGQQEDTVYSQLKAPKPGNHWTETDSLEGLYAEVYKKPSVMTDN